MEAFVYCWTDHKTNKLYIGSHKGSADDGYVCSSKYMMEEYENRSSDFTREIIATGTEEDIRKLETKILTSLNAASSDMFYNKHNGFGQYLTKEIRQKIGVKSRQTWDNLSEEQKEAWRLKMSEVNKRPKTEKEKDSMRGQRPHVNQSGSRNNNAKTISTPFGVFGSIKECSEKTGIAYDNVHYKLRAKHKEWEYLSW
jgi:hypothetical protein